jgi:hypothetical protein
MKLVKNPHWRGGARAAAERMGGRGDVERTRELIEGEQLDDVNHREPATERKIRLMTILSYL